MSDTSIQLTPAEHRLITRLRSQSHVTRNVNVTFDTSMTTGQRIADRVATFGGSWTFILLFLGILFGWIILNAILIAAKPFDPYPFILLNLVLSMLAAIQAPIIMMSQNRQAAKDRIDAEHDYEINLKAEMEIEQLHQKLDELREQRWGELVAMQQEQIRMLTQLIGSA